jgi:hypothetical protein
MNLSNPKMNNAPIRKPTAAGIHDIVGYILSDISIAGFSNDQKLAAIITPPVNPSIASSNPLCIVLKRNTKAAPLAVKAHVKQVA